MPERLLHHSVVFNIDCGSYRIRTHRARSEQLHEGVVTSQRAEQQPAPALSWGLSVGGLNQSAQEARRASRVCPAFS
jgi:hypothetical protein